MSVARLQAPRPHGAVLAEPPLPEAGTLLERNRQRFEHSDVRIMGRALGDLRRAARRTSLAAAQEYLRRSGEPLPTVDESASLLVTGHQPELFHPGVWIKNFAVNGLARAHQAVPLNLVIDSDTAKATSLKVPCGTEATTSVHRRTILFDRWAPEIPHEERRVLDESLFAGFPERVAACTRSWGFEPLLPAFWRDVQDQSRRTAILGERLVAARRACERRWGCHNLEVPLSLVCQTEPFAWFAGHLLSELPRFQAIYNDCVRAYRRRHGIRSHLHPVPELATEGDWLEAPLWGWRTSGTLRRERLLARVDTAGWKLRLGVEPEPVLASAGNASTFATAWQELESRGIKIRSRALTTTLYARLFLSDAFIHGIGGALYDELTDDIIQRFYGCTAPEYLVLSATWLLPFSATEARPADCGRLAGMLRDYRCNPQRHLDGARPEALSLATHKNEWIVREFASARQRRERRQTLRNLTRQLRSYLEHQERNLEEQLQRCRLEQQAAAVLQRRDYAFCLYPEESLREFCVRFL